MRTRHWGDEWLTPGQVRRMLGLHDARVINLAIHGGRLPATRWQNWRIWKSAIPRGKTLNYRGYWVPARKKERA